MTPPPDVECRAESRSADHLFDSVYAELRALAAEQLARERPGHTLTPTCLVHEAYVRLARRGREWNDRGHFLRSAARAMRHILISHARTRQRLKRGGGHRRVDLGGVDPAFLPPDHLLALDDALTALQESDPQTAAVVELRYFAGADWAEVGAALGVPEARAKQLWSYAKAWLFLRLGD